MKKKALKYFLTILLLLFNSISIAQDSKNIIDSLIATPHDVIVSEPKRIIEVFKSHIEISQNIGYNFGTAKLYTSLALAYSAMSEYDKYREAEIIAIRLFEEMDNEIELVSEYGLFGFHLRKTNLESSKYYMRLAIKLGEKNNLEEELRGIYDNYGIVLEFSNELDSALFYYEKALKLKYAASDSLGIPYGLNHLATIHATLGNMDKAFNYMAESDEYRAKEKSIYGRAENAVVWGELYSAVEEYDLAIIKFNESLKLAKVMSNKHMAQYNYEKLAEIYQKKGDYKTAFINLKNHKTYKDSILNTETNERIAELEIKFESEKKDKEISASKFKLKEQRGEFIFVLSISIILLIVSIGIYQFQKYKRKQVRTELELKNKLSKVKYENKISDEKLRISRELHDNIGSHLTFMISSIDNLTYRSKDEKHISTLNKLSSFGRNTLNELRQTIWAMKNDESDLEQLVLKLREFKKQIITDIEISISNNVTYEVTLSSTQTLNLFRVVQEAIQNSIKYAKASIIEIDFSDSENGIDLTIKDDGVGFDILTAEMGNGISNMKYRCKEAGAKFSVLSNENGTKIICSVQLSK